MVVIFIEINYLMHSLRIRDAKKEGKEVIDVDGSSTVRRRLEY